MPGVRAARKERTRGELVDAGRRLFAEQGYADVGLSAVVAAAGVTKGALYHQFDGKAELFHAVLARVQQEVADVVAEAAGAHDDPWEQFHSGCRAFLEAATAPGRARILLIDGPAVLGWRNWRALDDAASGAHLVDALAALVAAGEIEDQPVTPLAHVLSGAMNEAALRVAESGDDPVAVAQTWHALEHVLVGLRRARPPGA